MVSAKQIILAPAQTKGVLDRILILAVLGIGVAVAYAVIVNKKNIDDAIKSTQEFFKTTAENITNTITNVSKQTSTGVSSFFGVPAGINPKGNLLFPTKVSFEKPTALEAQSTLIESIETKKRAGFVQVDPGTVKAGIVLKRGTRTAIIQDPETLSKAVALEKVEKPKLIITPITTTIFKKQGNIRSRTVR